MCTLYDEDTWDTFKLTPAQRFAKVPGLNDMFPGNGVQRVWDTFSLVWWVCQKCQPNQEQREYKSRDLKRQLAQCVQVKSFNMCPLQLMQQLKILEDMFVVRVL